MIGAAAADAGPSVGLLCGSAGGFDQGNTQAARMAKSERFPRSTAEAVPVGRDRGIAFTGIELRLVSRTLHRNEVEHREHLVEGRFQGSQPLAASIHFCFSLSNSI